MKDRKLWSKIKKYERNKCKIENGQVKHYANEKKEIDALRKRKKGNEVSNPDKEMTK